MKELFYHIDEAVLPRLRRPEVFMSETIKNLGSNKKFTKRDERNYDRYLDDPLTYSLDEMLQTLGPRREQIRR